MLVQSTAVILTSPKHHRRLIILQHCQLLAMKTGDLNQCRQLRSNKEQLFLILRLLG